MKRPEIEAALAVLPELPRDRDGPVFREPWHAQAFALAVSLHERGHFTWPEWAEALGAEIGRSPSGDEAEDRYYLAWLAALERLLDAKTIIAEDERQKRRDAWDRAARATPHGEPIVLGRETMAK